jgi:hypothetical protein
MYEATSKAVAAKGCAGSERTPDYEISVPIRMLKEYADDGNGFVECEAIVCGKNGQPLRSICRMTYDEAMVLSELPSEDSTPVPLTLLFDDAALDLARGIRGGLVNIEGRHIYRTDLAENAVYLIRKTFSDAYSRHASAIPHRQSVTDRLEEGFEDTTVLLLDRCR